MEESALHLLLSQLVGRGFEPGLVLEIFRVSQPVGRGFDPLLRHTFFAISVSRKISRCLAGVLLFHWSLFVVCRCFVVVVTALPWANRLNLNFCRNFGRALLVTSGVSKKTLMKSHENGRLFPRKAWNKNGDFDNVLTLPIKISS